MKKLGCKWGKTLGLAIIIFFIIFAKLLFANINNTAVLLDVNSAIGPATEDYIHRGIDQAIQQQAQLIIIQMDTPGGLDKSMRAIVKDIIASPIPIVTFVAPQGARAASAGTYIVYASHFAAMAPATNLGAATPINLLGGNTSTPNTNNKNTSLNEQDTEHLKTLNDSTAYIRSLAELRGRNADWGEKAVTQSASLAAEEAKKIQVIDIIAKDIPDLLQQLDGKTIAIKNHILVLHTKNIQITEIKPDWRTNFLSVITDPSVAYILLLIGAYGIFFELLNPGLVLPGVMGGIALVIALYALQLLPINYAGLALILLGIMFMALEAYIPSYGALGLGGVVALATGSILLLDTSGPFAIPWLLIFTMTGISIIFFGTLIILTIRSRYRKVVTGKEALLGAIGTAKESFTEKGWIQLGGERWQAETHTPVFKNEAVQIIKIDGLLLTVKPIRKE